MKAPLTLKRNGAFRRGKKPLLGASVVIVSPLVYIKRDSTGLWSVYRRNISKTRRCAVDCYYACMVEPAPERCTKPLQIACFHSKSTVGVVCGRIPEHGHGNRRNHATGVSQ